MSLIANGRNGRRQRLKCDERFSAVRAGVFRDVLIPSVIPDLLILVLDLAIQTRNPPCLWLDSFDWIQS